MSKFSDIAIEDILDREGCDYRLTSGASGTQVNVRECPRCGNTNYKLYFNRETGLGNCWTCDPNNNKFNPFSFAKDILQAKGNGQVVEYLKTYHQAWSQPSIRSELILSGSMQIPESVALPVNGLLPAYLVERGIDAETARYFGLRYCHAGSYHYRVDDEPKAMDFSGRILFPVHDVSGRLVSFQGRAIDQRAIKKYLFPPGFSVSGSVIYNAHQAVAADTIILGEGVFDAMAIKIAIDRHRIENTVATASFGKHLACKSNGDDDQLSALLKLKKWFGLETIVLCWDGEKSAIYAALETMKKLEHVGFKTQFMRLPDNEDPGSIPASTLIDCFHRAEIYSPSLLTKAKLGAI